MIRLLAFLWSGCWHVWETIRVVSIWDRAESPDMPVGRKYECRCTKCGRITAFRV